MSSFFEAFVSDAARDHAAAAPLSAAGQQDRQRLEDAMNQARTASQNLQNHLISVEQDRGLTPEGKEQHRSHAVSRWARAAEDHVRQTQTMARLMIEQREGLLSIRSLNPDPILSQQLLANARTDAQMALASLPGGQVVPRMLELARENNPLGYLLSTTDWGELYISSRSTVADVELWQASKSDLRRPWLVSDRARAAFDDLAGLRDLAASASASVAVIFLDTLGRHGYRA